MTRDDGDLILVHDCEYPERMGIWQRTMVNSSYQLQDYIERRKEQDRQDVLAHRKLCMIYAFMIAVSALGFWLIA